MLPGGAQATAQHVRQHAGRVYDLRRGRARHQHDEREKGDRQKQVAAGRSEQPPELIVHPQAHQASRRHDAQGALERPDRNGLRKSRQRGAAEHAAGHADQVPANFAQPAAAQVADAPSHQRRNQEHAGQSIKQQQMMRHQRAQAPAPVGRDRARGEVLQHAVGIVRIVRKQAEQHKKRSGRQDATAHEPGRNHGIPGRELLLCLR